MASANLRPGGERYDMQDARAVGGEARDPSSHGVNREGAETEAALLARIWRRREGRLLIVHLTSADISDSTGAQVLLDVIRK